MNGEKLWSKANEKEAGQWRQERNLTDSGPGWSRKQVKQKLEPWQLLQPASPTVMSRTKYLCAHWWQVLSSQQTQQVFFTPCTDTLVLVLVTALALVIWNWWMHVSSTSRKGRRQAGAAGAGPGAFWNSDLALCTVHPTSLLPFRFFPGNHQPSLSHSLQCLAK